MIPKKLELHNFLAYRDKVELHFDGIHLACLTGANGAGKSSLLDAITWVLWGEARKARDEELIHLGQDHMSVELNFEQEGTLYKVIRKRTRKTGGTLALYAMTDSGWNEIGEGAIKQTQQKINRLLRLEHATFIDSAFLQQGKADSFTTKTPRERKQTLAEILGLARWEAYEAAAKLQIKTLDEDIQRVAFRIGELHTQIDREPALRRDLAAAQQAQTEAETTLKLAEAQLKLVENATAQLKDAQTRRAESQQRLNNYTRDRADAERELARLAVKVADAEALIAAQPEIESGYAALQAARTADEELADKLTTLRTYDERLAQLRAGLEQTRLELEGEAKQHDATIKAETRTIEKAQPDEYHALLTQIEALAGAEPAKTDQQAAIEQMRGEQGRLKAVNEALWIEMQELKDRIERLKKADGSAACPLCGQPLTDDHRVRMLNDLQHEGKTKGDAYRANTATLEQLTGELAAAAAAIKRLEGEVRQWNELKERAAALKQGIDQAAAAELRRAPAAAALAAVRDQLAAATYGQELRQQIAEVTAERDALGYDGSRHDGARQTLKSYQAYDERYTRLQIMLEALPGDRMAHDQAAARRDRLSTDEAAEAAALALIDAQIAALTVQAQEFHQRRDEHAAAFTRCNLAQQKVGAVQQELSAIATHRAELSDRRAEEADLRDQRSLYDQLKLAFGKNGVPAMIIEAAIPELEAGANRLLTRMTDGRMRVTLPTQKEKVTGGLAETLDIVIADELGQRSYELYSGGEAFRINFALRVALSQMLARRAGAHLRTLFIDEGFGTQDEEGRARLIEAITAVKDDFDLILAITHIDELRDLFPVHITVEKSSTGSQVKIR